MHQHPELSNKEQCTKERLLSFCKENTDLEVVDKGNWFYVAYRNRDARQSIAFRADFDALPMDEVIDVPHASKIEGVSHKCGHDGHSATLMAFALELDRYGCDYNVFLLFQHAEETGDGAKECIELFELEHVDKMFGYHNMSGMKLNTINVIDGHAQCASTGMIVKLKGKPSHASLPEDGSNPSETIAKLVLELPQLTGESDGLLLATVVNVDIGEKDFGMSASYGEIGLTIRALYESELLELRDNIVEFVLREANDNGLEVSFEYRDSFPETVNDEAVTDEVREAAKTLGLEVVEMEQALRGSEDYGHYQKHVPATYFYVGNGEKYPPIHTSEYDFIDNHIETVCNIYRQLVGIK